jgi:hypothetical protein
MIQEEEKQTMSRNMIVSALAICLMVGILASAQAQTSLPPPYESYAAKFVCGRFISTTAPNFTGTFETAINIHNPQSQVQVLFRKKIVVANAEGQQFQTPIVLQDNLPPDFAEYVDCALIYKIANIPVGTPIDGFVVLEVPPSTPGQPLLDVVGSYKTYSASGVSSHDVVSYSGTLIKF